MTRTNARGQYARLAAEAHGIFTSARESTDMPKTFDCEVCMGKKNILIDKEQTGQKISFFLNRNYKTLREASDATGIALCVMSEVSRGKKPPTLETVIGLADAMNLDVTQLVVWERRD